MHSNRRALLPSQGFSEDESVVLKLGGVQRLNLSIAEGWQSHHQAAASLLTMCMAALLSLLARNLEAQEHRLLGSAGGLSPSVRPSVDGQELF